MKAQINETFPFSVIWCSMKIMKCSMTLKWMGTSGVMVKAVINYKAGNMIFCMSV